MTWLSQNLHIVGALLVDHLVLSIVPIVLAILISVPLGWLAYRYRATRGLLLTVAGLLYTIPSLALFILMPLLLGTRILDRVNVVVAMTLYTVALLVRTVADALAAVPESVTSSATAMGLRPVRRLLTVELPLAVPVIAAGLRVAAVSNVSIVSVAALIGVPQLGSLFTDGFYRDFLDPILAGLVACVLLALAFDVVIVVLARVLTPWLRTGQGGRA